MREALRLEPRGGDFMRLRAWCLAAAGVLANAGCSDVREHGVGPAAGPPSPDGRFARTGSAKPDPELRVEPAPLGELAEARFRHSATLLRDGTLLIAGGGLPDSDRELGFEPLASAEQYLPSQDRFRSLEATLATARGAHTATRLLDGSVLIVGGFDRDGLAVREAELYEPEAQTFSPAGDLLTPRALHTATLLGDGRVLIVGGTSTLGAGPPVADAEIYDPARGRFEACADSPPASAAAHSAALLEDGRVLLVWPGSERAQLFDPATRRFVAAAEPLPALGRLTGMSRADDGNLLLFTQDRSDDSTIFGVVVLDAEGGAVAALGEPSWVPEHADAEVSVTRAHGLICSDTQGLCAPSAGAPTGHESVVRMDLSERRGHTASALADGSVLLVGGTSNEDGALRVLSSSQRLDFARWNAAPAASPMATSQTASMLSDGRVLLTGGLDPKVADRAAVFDGRTLTAAGRLAAPRTGHVCLPLLDGTALIAGGEVASGANEEILDWRSGRSRDAGFRLEARGNGVALSDGRYLFAGPELVEIYDSKRGPPTLHVTLPAPLGCPRPPLARLENGRVLVLGQRAALEVDVEARDVSGSSTSELTESHCNAQVAVLADGTALIVQSTSSGGVARLERYDPAEPDAAARLTVVSNGSPLTARGKLFSWFDRPAWLAGGSLATYDPRRSLFEPGAGLRVGSEPSSPSVADVVVLPDATLLVVGSERVTRWSSSWVKPGARACCWDFPSRAPRVHMGEERTLRARDGALLFPETWPEGSSGTTNASAGNVPLPVWLPMGGGPAASASLRSWSSEEARLRVPHTAFPGLGLLVLAVNGEHTALGPLEIAPSPAGDACESSGECQSGHCVDGVCCDRACDGACEACRAETKASGRDGVCGFARAGSAEQACAAEAPETCGRTGSCDARGRCAPWPDGTVCNQALGLVCVAGGCTGRGQCEPNRREQLRLPDGSTEDCGEYRCSISENRCLTACSSNLDCREGLVCSSSRGGRCELPLPPATLRGGCALARHFDTGVTRAGAQGLLIAAGVLARRRRRRGLTTRAARGCAADPRAMARRRR